MIPIQYNQINKTDKTFNPTNNKHKTRNQDTCKHEIDHIYKIIEIKINVTNKNITFITSNNKPKIRIIKLIYNEYYNDNQTVNKNYVHTKSTKYIRSKVDYNTPIINICTDIFNKIWSIIMFGMHIKMK